MADDNTTRMVAPDGTVIDVAPQDMPIAQAHKFVAYGSPQHMAMLGTPGPGAPQSVATTPIRPTAGTKAAEAAQPFIGAAKGMNNTGIGIARLLAKVPGLNRAPGLQPSALDQASAASVPNTTGQRIGYAGEQVGEMLLPAGAASEAGKAVKVGEKMLPLVRDAAGRFTAAKYVPKATDLVRQAVTKAAVQSAATGAVNAAQGGKFSTGAALGAGGAAAGEVATALAPIAKTIISNPIVRHILGSAVGVGTGYGVASGHISPGTLSKASIAILLAHPVGRQILMQALRSGPAVGASLMRSANQPTPPGQPNMPSPVPEP